MFLAGLGLVEFLALLGALAGLVTLPYLFDRFLRRKIVSSLRFWRASARPPHRNRLGRIREPLSWLLQLLAGILLLLAIGQLHLGSRNDFARDHVLILDNSAWMGARSGQSTLMEKAKVAALAYVKSVPAGDRVLLALADATVTPLTAFEANRETIAEAVRGVGPGTTALRLEEALEFARRLQDLHARQPGEIVFVGAGLLPGSGSFSRRELPRGLRFIPVRAAGENVGLKKVGLRRQGGRRDEWEVYVAARNYGSSARSVDLLLEFGKAPVGSRRLRLEPGKDQESTFPLRTRATGLLEVRLLVADALDSDNSAVIEVPASVPAKVIVYTQQPALLRPLIEADLAVEAEFRAPAQYRSRDKNVITVLDRFVPPEHPAGPAIWIAPPGQGAPARVKQVAAQAPVRQWGSEHALGEGLRTQDLRLERTQVFEPVEGDIVVASVDSGAAVLARTTPARHVIFGFHPARSTARFELAVPLLFANVLRWLAPAAHGQQEVLAESGGAVSLPVGPDIDAAKVKVQNSAGGALPFSLNDGVLRFFSATADTVRVTTGEREWTFSLTLPEVGESGWEPPGTVRSGLPSGPASSGSPKGLWQALALAAGLVLLLEWLRYGNDRWRRKPGTDSSAADEPAREGGSAA